MLAILVFVLCTFVTATASFGCLVNPCEHICHAGFFTSTSCSCRPGYAVSSTDRTKCVYIPPLNTCKKGFRPSARDPQECEDINECESASTNPCEQTCSNSRGSFECGCRSGYQIREDDSNRCEVISKPAGCKPGFRPSPRDPRECEDIDECASASTNPCEQTCSNSRGSYECGCRSGFQVSESNPNKCESTSRPPTSCRPGFRPSPADPRECEDIDECASASTNPCEQTCSNSRGSYECGCRSGFQVSESNPNKCVAISNCGSGFRPSAADPRECEDINECENTGRRVCQQVCTNTRGGYRCSCNEGFIVSSSDSSQCQAVDPCGAKPCEHTCAAAGNNFVCSCRSGYRVKDVVRCEDVNECSGSRNPCEQTCTNTDGGFSCSCTAGFTVSSSDNTKCESSNPCANNKCEHECTVSGSSFKCTCNKGYQVSSSDPTRCDDVDECAKEPCEHQCTNTKGSYTCTCPEGFAPSQTDKTKCIAANACNTARKCEHICTVIPGGRKCSCRDGYAVNEEDDTLCDEIEVCKAKADIIMIFDASSSIFVENFDKQFIFAKRLTRNFNIGPNAVRFGGVVFSRKTEILFNLKDYDTHEGLSRALTGVKYMNSSTYTHEAFNLVLNSQLFSVEKGGRDNIQNIALLFTDGNPTLKDKAIDAAQALKNSGVLIISVGIGKDLDMALLKQMSSSPEDAIEASNYDMLDYIEKRLSELLCKTSSG